MHSLNEIKHKQFAGVFFLLQSGTQLASLGSSFSHRGYFILSRRIVFSLGEQFFLSRRIVLSLTEDSSFSHRMHRSNRAYWRTVRPHEEVAPPPTPPPQGRGVICEVTPTSLPVRG